MKSEQLAEQISAVCEEATNRVLGVGDIQYAIHGYYNGEERQRFEEETEAESLTGLEEELLDCINWAAMAILKIRERRDNPPVKVEFIPLDER